MCRLGQLEAELLPLMGYMPSDEDLAKSLADLEKFALSFTKCLIILMLLLHRQKKQELDQVTSSVKRDSSDLSGLEAQLVEFK